MTILNRLPHGPEAVFIRDVIAQEDNSVTLIARFTESMESLGISNVPGMTSWFVEVMAQATIYLLPTDKPATGFLAKIHSLESNRDFDPHAALVFRLQRISNGYGALQIFEGTVAESEDAAEPLARVRFSIFWSNREV